MRILGSQTDRASSLTHPSLLGHIQIARADHWIKNVFVLPGIVVAIGIDRDILTSILTWPIIVGLISVCLVSSSNYVINELLDASSDREHPVKWRRPVPSGRVSIPLAYLQWIVLMITAIA